MAHIIEVTDKNMLATERCDRCGAQAYMEVCAPTWPTSLLFCAHHAAKNFDALNESPEVMIADHRPVLVKAEGGQRDAASAV